MIYNNGDEYDGEWKDDMRNGEGEIFYINEQYKFKGEFENNIEKNGEGIVLKEEYKYIGKIKESKRMKMEKYITMMVINIMVNLKRIKRMEKV